ncbi:MAG: hypothetical protein HC916_09690 [Coleofasciculaceae cyanobacterium SM2_1_6]|nr:hypothetical protein [Coleofasciculaceae cyanobacterium SM2_1_6]
MRCNLVSGFAALLAAAVIASVNFLSFPASSALENTIATNDRAGCEHKNGCFPL